MKGRRGDKGILGVPEHPVLPTGEHWVQREVVEGNRGRQEGRRTPYVGKGSGVLGSQSLVQLYSRRVTRKHSNPENW